MTTPRILVVALVVFFECHAAQEASPVELPRLSGMVNGFASFLEVGYAEDLDVRLERFNRRTGYAIVVVVIPSGEDERISDLISQLFVNNGLEKWGLAGTVLILVTVQEGWVIVEPSKKVERKFLRPGALERIEHFSEGELREHEAAVERRVEAVLEILDPWFHVLDPPAAKLNPMFARTPIAEIILFPLAPFLGLMVGAALMAFTSGGQLRTSGRFLVSGFAGCFVAVAAAFVVRQPGGIVPGILYYSAVLSFVVSALVGVLKPFWFTETVRGRKPGEKMHPPFFGRG